MAALCNNVARASSTPAGFREDLRRRFAVPALLAVMAAAALGAGTVTGSASASPGASCVGLESSNHAESRSETAHFIRDNYAELGFATPGDLVSFFAQLHLGSDEVCFG